MMRLLLLATALLSLLAPAAAQDVFRAPVLRASITVSGGVVRVGDFVSNSGAAAQIPLFRAPNPGSIGTLPVEQVLAALRQHNVIGVDTQDIAEVEVTRASRAVAEDEVRARIARSLAHRNGLGDAADITVTFDRDVATLQFDATAGEMEVTSLRYSPASHRFDVTFALATDTRGTPIRLRFTGTAIETAEVAVTARTIERGEILKTSDVVTERRPKYELQGDSVSLAQTIGLAAKRPLRAGQPLRVVDLAKPELVAKDQSVTIIFEIPGIHLTMRGKAMESGAQGDVVNVLNLQSKRVIQGTVAGPGQIKATSAMMRLSSLSPRAVE